MNLKGILAMAVCLAVAGVAVAEDGMGHSRPRSVTAVCALNSADVSWESMSEPNLTGYNVYRKVTGEPSYTKANAQLVTATEFTVQGLLAAVTYDFAVTAVYYDGESDYSQPATCTTG